MEGPVTSTNALPGTNNSQYPMTVGTCLAKTTATIMLSLRPMSTLEGMIVAR